MLNTKTTKSVQQGRLIRGHAKGQFEAFFRIWQAQAHALSGHWPEHEELGTLAQSGGQFVDVALGSALAVVQHSQNDRPVAFDNAAYIGSQARSRRYVVTPAPR